MSTGRLTARQRQKRKATEMAEESTESPVTTSGHEIPITETSATDIPIQFTSTAAAAAATITVTTSSTTSTSSSRGTGVTSTKVQRTTTITQPTMERFSTRLVASSTALAEKAAKENPFELIWKEQDSLFYLISQPTAAKPIGPSKKIAAFDMDGTLIRTSSGRQFPVSRNDWRWLIPEVPKRLKALYEDGWKVVIFTNQNGISTGKQSAAEIKGKILDLIKDCGVPMQAFVASADDLYRKPSTNMWSFFQQHCNGGLTVDMTQSVYVGDAAGRPANWDHSGVKKDFSASDRKFAFNCSLNFHTPEEYFLNKPKAQFSWGSVDPTLLIAGAPTPTPTTHVAHTTDDPASEHLSKPLKAAAAAAASTSSSTASTATSSSTGVPVHHGPYHLTNGSTEVILFCGFPASGKSTFAQRHLVPHGYVHVNQDKMKTKEKCLKATIEALSQGRSVVVDNTNPGADTRALYIAQARKFGVPIRCFQFITQEEVAKHLNMFREKLTAGAHPHVPRIAYNTYKKNFQAPSTKEGFQEIKLIDFVPSFPSTPAGEAAKKLFYELS